MPGFKYRVSSVADPGLSPTPKMFLALESDEQAVGRYTIVPGFTGELEVKGLGFQPDLVVLLNPRPRYFAGTSDTTFGARAGWLGFGVGHRDGTQFAASINVRQGFDGPHYARWDEDRIANVIRHASHGVLLEAELVQVNADGFRIDVLTNQYDQAQDGAWLALKGGYKVGFLNSGDTSITGAGFRPTGAWFTSVKVRDGDGPLREGWDLLNGFACPEREVSVWGGGRSPSASNWWRSTGRWDDEHAITLSLAADLQAAAGDAQELAKANVSSWDAGGLTLDWLLDDLEDYRIGYVLAEKGEAVRATEWYDSRPPPSGGGVDGEVETERVEPRALLGTTTGFFRSHPSPLPAQSFHLGGHGYLSIGAAPWALEAEDEFVIGVAQGTIAELGRYLNSAGHFYAQRILGGMQHDREVAYARHFVDVYELVPKYLYAGFNFRHSYRHRPRAGNLPPT